MGIIIRQSFKGTVWSYLGVLIGFVTVSYLYPNYLTTDTIGLFSLFVSYSALFAQFSSLGMNGITLRLFPKFRDKANGHNGYLYISSIVLLVGFLGFLIAFWMFAPWLIENNLEKSALFSEYLYLLVPITLFTIIYTFLDVYNKLLYNAVFGTFLQEFLQRLLVLIITLVYVFGLISLNWLIIGYAAILCVKAIVILSFLIKQKEVHFARPHGFINESLRKEMIGVAVFSILSSMGTTIIFNIDKIFINQFLGLDQTGVYNIAFFFSTLIVIPSRPLLKISGTLIADAWNKNKTEEVKQIYYKSCINQYIIGSFIFLGIWVNIDNILVILGPEYIQGKWVIFFIGLGNLFDMATGANTQVINYSKYYKSSMTFILSLIVVFVISLFIFIPIWGIVGAAVSVALSLFLNNIARFLFLYFKFKFQPFSGRFLVASAIFLLIFFIVRLIPTQTLVFDILTRSILVTILAAILIFVFKVSDDMNTYAKKVLQLLKK